MPTQDTKKSTRKAPEGGKSTDAKAKTATGKQVHRVGKPTNPYLERHPPKKVQKR